MLAKYIICGVFALLYLFILAPTGTSGMIITFLICFSGALTLFQILLDIAKTFEKSFFGT